ncbi:hypothetical protein WDV94_13130 [Clavibacter tessellarius]
MGGRHRPGPAAPPRRRVGRRLRLAGARAGDPSAAVGDRRPRRHALSYLRFDAERPGGLPVILTNGWPSLRARAGAARGAPVAAVPLRRRPGRRGHRDRPGAPRLPALAAAAADGRADARASGTG